MSSVLSLALESTWKYVTHVSCNHPNMVIGIVGGSVWLVSKAVYQIFLYPRFFSPLRRVPGPPLGHPIYGQFTTILKGEAGIPQREWVKEYGHIVRVVGPIGLERLIFMSPEAMYKILVSDWVDYPRPDFMRHGLGVFLGYGLLTVADSDHKQMRKAMNPAFSVSNLLAQSDMYWRPIEDLIGVINNELDIKSLEEPSTGREFVMYEWYKVTLDILCDTAFGYQTNSLHNPHNDISEAYKTMTGHRTGSNVARLIAIASIPGFTRLLGSRWTYSNRHFLRYLPFFRHIVPAIEFMYRIRAVSTRMLAEKLNDSTTSMRESEEKRDVMSILVRAHTGNLNSDGYTMNDRTIEDQVLTFLGVGHDTVAAGLSWTLWFLAKDPQAQQKLRDEVSPIFRSTSRPNYRDLKDLTWLDCIIQESLRLMPPVPMTFRQAAKTDHIDGILVPEGTYIYVPIRVINTWSEIWGPDSEEWNPGRWLNLPPKYNSTFSSLSFLAGPHTCIGKAMAIIEMKTIVAALINSFEFSPAYEGQIAQPVTTITMKPKDNMLLRVRKVIA